MAQAIRNWVAQLDAPVIDINLDESFDVLNRHAQRVLFYETAQTHYHALIQGNAESSVQSIGLMGLGLPQSWYEVSMQSRPILLQDFVNKHFAKADFLITPSLAATVPDWQTVEIGHPSFDRAALFAMHRYMGFVNYLGLPSLNLPIGRDPRGRAICVQVLARPFAEHHLLNFAEKSPFVFGISEHMPKINACSALSRFKVIDLSRVRAGPNCVRILTDFGADVIRVEPLPGSTRTKPCLRPIARAGTFKISIATSDR